MRQDAKNNIFVYLQPAFLICSVVLALSGIGMSVAIKSLGVYLRKEPLPLKKSLDLLDEKKIGPYKVVAKEKIGNKKVVESLGTEDYIQWTLEDTTAEADSDVGQCLLFITYYDLPDRVPHEPEECYAGTGYQRLSTERSDFRISKDGVEEKIPVTHLVFANKSSGFWDKDTKFSVFYLFNANKTYTDSREKTIIILRKNIFGKHSYYSKVEWYFLNLRSDAKTYLKKEDAVAASQKLLSVILPLLEKEHWPDWNK